MIALSDVREWIKHFDIGENFFIGKLDNKKDKSIGIYSRKRSGPPVMAYGGLENSKYDIKPISVLIHWNKNADETERTAFNLFKAIQSEKNRYMGSIQIYYVELKVPEPVNVGTDDKGIYEYVIEFDIYYERNDL